MKNGPRTLLAFSITGKPIIPTQRRFQTGSVCIKRPQQLSYPIHAAHSRKHISTTIVSSAARGSPILGVTMSTTDQELSLPSHDGHEVSAYFVRPEETAQVAGRGVILMTDILGYKNEDTRSVATRFAEAGLPVIVPDLFRGEPWKQGRSMTEYESWRSQHDPGRVQADVQTAHSFLTEKGYHTRLGMLGFCYGGGRVMEEIAKAFQGLNPKVAVAFYPTRFDPEPVARNATCSLLLISGDEDELVPMSVVEKLQEGVGEESCAMEDCEIQIVEGAGHAFAHHPKTEQNEIDGEIVLSRAVRYLTSKL